MRARLPTLRAAILLAAFLLAAELAVASLFSSLEGTRQVGATSAMTSAICILAGHLSVRMGDARTQPHWTASLLLGAGFSFRWFSPSWLEGSYLTVASFNAVLIASVFFLALGRYLARTPDVLRFGFLGAVSLATGTGSIRFVSEFVLNDPDDLWLATLVGAGLSALGTGFFLAFLRRSLAFSEMVLSALICVYALYLAVALGPEDLIRAWSLPIEQVLLALSLFPILALLGLLAVGGSLGFLLFGGGRYDGGFSFERAVAARYLRVNVKLARVSVGYVAFLILSVVVGLIAAAKVYVAAYEIFLPDSWPTFITRWLEQFPRWARAGIASGSVFALVLVPFLRTFVRGIVRRERDRTHAREVPFVGAITAVSVIGVALGVMALVVVLSVMSGFEADLKRKILGAHAHVVVEKYGDDFAEFSLVEEKAKQTQGVTKAAAFVLGDAMLSTDGGLSGAMVKGIDPTSDDAVRDLRKNLRMGKIRYLEQPNQIPGACGRRHFPPRPPPASSETSTTSGRLVPAKPIALNHLSVLGSSGQCSKRVLPGIILGQELSRTLRAYVGDVVKLISPASDDIGPLGPMPKLRRYRVAGTYRSGMYEYDAKLAYIKMDRAQRFFGLRGRASGVELEVSNVDRTQSVVSELARRLGGHPYRIKDWRMMNRELFSALLLEKIAMFVALAMIVMVASFLIVATLVMIVLQRGREIAILKSLGASSASIMKIFVIQGVFVGVGGALLGVVGGLAICLMVSTVGFPLPKSIFYIEQLPVVLDPTEVGIIAISATMITYLATIYPAMYAAELHPVDGLREE